VEGDKVVGCIVGETDGKPITGAPVGEARGVLEGLMDG